MDHKEEVNICRHINKAIIQLGANPAARLIEKGCKGVPQKEEACLVTCFIIDVLTQAGYKIKEVITFYSESLVILEDTRVAVVPLPENIQALIKEFDEGLHPELIAV